MANRQQAKSDVRAKYIQGMPLSSASELSGVAYPTARNWKRKAKTDGDDWDIARAARRMSNTGIEEMTGQILEEMSAQFMATLTALKANPDMPPAQKAEILSRLSDSYVKTINAAGKGNPRLSTLSIAMDILRDLTAFIATNNPAMREPFIEILEAFGPEIAKKYG